ncbi:hypothetical protein D3C73_1141310 [compost metagenome]
MRHEGMPALDVGALVVAFFSFVGNLKATAGTRAAHALGVVWEMTQRTGRKIPARGGEELSSRRLRPGNSGGRTGIHTGQQNAVFSPLVKRVFFSLRCHIQINRILQGLDLLTGDFD